MDVVKLQLSVTKFLSFFFFCLIIYLFLAVLGLHCHRGFPLDVASKGYSLVSVLRFLTAVVSLVVEHGLYGTRASVVMAHEL